MRKASVRLHPLHPAAWVLDRLRDAGWQVHDLLVFTRASTLVLVSREGRTPVVLKAGFGSNHVLAELDEDTRRAAYGFYWYAELTPVERALTREDFRHEIDLTRQASGITGVVPLLEAGGTDRFDWYTMPYCPGGNFGPFLSAGHPSTPENAAGLGVLADVADALGVLHARGVVHRDVYQENILIRDGHGLITDLGAARRLDTPRGPARRGPEVHWPPEYTTSYKTATPAADVFSLAVLTFRFCRGDLPRYGPDPHAFHFPGPLRDVLPAALAQAPGDRPPMSAFRDALREAATETNQPF